MQNRAKTASEIVAMREGGQLLATVLDVLKKSVQPGMTTKDLSEIAKKELHGTGGIPTELGYLGFPDVLCVSVNDEVVHGIPSREKLINDGDIVSMDFAVTYDGMITDSATSVIAGKPKEKKHGVLLHETQKALYAGISTVGDGVRIGDISFAIENVLKRGNYGIVRDLVGHGVGHELHESPDVPNYGKKGTGPKLVSGMTIAIEPMATLGDFRVYIDTDGWTIRTNDRSLAAHFEHTVLVTDEGVEILTELQ
jgi:methionyl aminopeptidase